MGRETGIFSDHPPGPPPLRAEPPPDFKLAARLVRDAEQRAVTRYTTIIGTYYASLLRLASGEVAEETLPPDFQRAVAVLRKSPGQIQADISEARKILAAQQWLAKYDPVKNKAELASVAAKISAYDAEIQREIARIRSAAAPFHKRAEELQRVEFSVTNNTYAAKAWDRWLEGRFEPDPEALDRIRGAM